MTAAALAPLAAHFDACAAAGTQCPVWWRDDDARACGPRLDALVRLADEAGAPLALAVIPEGAEPALLAFAQRQGIDVLQHGIAHTNHQRAGKSAELGDARAPADIIAALVEAREHLASPAFVPVLVPPWNRMREDLGPALAQAGYTGLSRFGAPPAAGPPRRMDTHIDPIAWHGGRSLAPADRLAEMARRAAATGGPIGLLTHHIDHDERVSAYVAAFAALVARHEGARWVSARDLFGAGAA